MHMKSHFLHEHWCARFHSKLHHSPSLLIPFISPINKGHIPFIYSSFDSQNTPYKLSRTRFSTTLFHSQSHSRLKLTIHSSSLNLTEANRIRIVPWSFLNRAIQVQVQSSESELRLGRNLHQILQNKTSLHSPHLLDPCDLHHLHFHWELTLNF